MSKVVVFDYGAGNLRSVLNTLGAIGAQYELVDDAEGLLAAEKIILPGVGHFGQMVRSLDAMRVRKPLLMRIAQGVPFLGICLGLQAMFEASEEAPDLEGLGLFAGKVKRFPDDARVPHMGWNELEVRAGSRLLRNLPPRPYLYFAHSYYVPAHEYAAATCIYSEPFTAVLEHENVYGVQFHPEKSGALGLQIVKNFVDL
ncbi:MAG: imidazole glycerol phosphate synthase subunit HisH [Acidobacteriota bacterium]|jgi:glutamine amidotransferase|nr:imidazole glycerol phosphate synthase subunit HisH [Bryobacteraceae bacterium CoA2 C42]MCA2962366.1 imidazole glycerol phosphate synthase subunit HisH [Acidobacteriaceae bacterium]